MTLYPSKASRVGYALLVVAGLTIVAAFGLSRYVARMERLEEVTSWRDMLVSQVKSTTEVTITEQSVSGDFLDAGVPAPASPLIYKFHVLTAGEKGRLVALLEGMSLEPPASGMACLPDFHHTLYLDGSTMNVCFRCGQISWGDSPFNPVAALVPTLSAALAELGFHPDANWKELARAGKEEPAR